MKKPWRRHFPEANECATCGKMARIQDPILVAALSSVFIETSEPEWMCQGHGDDDD